MATWPGGGCQGDAMPASACTDQRAAAGVGAELSRRGLDALHPDSYILPGPEPACPCPSADLLPRAGPPPHDPSAAHGHPTTTSPPARRTARDRSRSISACAI